MSKHSRLLAAGALLAATRIAAQQVEICPASPGVAFGITAISCPSCEIPTTADGRQRLTFLAEPVVLATRAGTKFMVGDVVEAVNARPITTAAGAALFARPIAGDNVITVRRGRDRVNVTTPIPRSLADCLQTPLERIARQDSLINRVRDGLAGLPATTRPPATATDSMVARIKEVLAHYDSSTRRLGTVQMRDGVLFSDPAQPLIVVDGVPVSSERAFIEFQRPENAGYGFALACVPSCTAATGTEGKTQFTYYKYDGTPPIIGVRPGSAADRAGIKVGDVVLRVDGIPITDDAASIRLWSVHRKPEIRLTLLRAAKEVTSVIKFP